LDPIGLSLMILVNDGADVIVVGAGLAGLVATAELANSEVR
jgi:monoamine oxidase